jgi:hypothetical protein
MQITHSHVYLAPNSPLAIPAKHEFMGKCAVKAMEHFIMNTDGPFPQELRDDYQMPELIRHLVEGTKFATGEHFIRAMSCMVKDKYLDVLNDIGQSEQDHIQRKDDFLKRLQAGKPEEEGSDSGCDEEWERESDPSEQDSTQREKLPGGNPEEKCFDLKWDEDWERASKTAVIMTLKEAHAYTDTDESDTDEASTDEEYANEADIIGAGNSRSSSDPADHTASKSTIEIWLELAAAVGGGYGTCLMDRKVRRFLSERKGHDIIQGSSLDRKGNMVAGDVHQPWDSKSIWDQSTWPTEPEKNRTRTAYQYAKYLLRMENEI